MPTVHSMRFVRIALWALLAMTVPGAAPRGLPQDAAEKQLPATPSKPLSGVDPVPSAGSGPAGSGWIPLFNGVDLEGWTPKIRGFEVGENFADTFRVEDGILKVGYEGYEEFGGRFGHLFFREKFSHYLLRVEYRFVGNQVSGGPGWALRNSGVMLHGQDPESMARDQDFPVSIEVQFLGGNGRDERPTLNLCTPGTHVVFRNELYKPHCLNSSSPTVHGDDWVTAVIEVRGNQRIRHFLNDQLVLEYTQPQLDPGDANARPLIHGDSLQLEGGTVSLQSESHPVEFRSVGIRLIDAGSPLSDELPSGR